MKRQEPKTKATFESVWKTIQETSLLQKEAKEMQLETNRFMNVLQQKLDATSELMRKNEINMDRMNKRIESWGYNHGKFAEEYFYNSFEDGNKTFFGETFDEVEGNMQGRKKGFRDEYDIVMINGTSIGIIESKYKAHVNDIPKVLRKPETLRINFPEYEHYKIYLALASMSFYDELEEKCLENGIAIVKQIGENVVINETGLKVF